MVSEVTDFIIADHALARWQLICLPKDWSEAKCRKAFLDATEIAVEPHQSRRFVHTGRRLVFIGDTEQDGTITVKTIVRANNAECGRAYEIKRDARLGKAPWFCNEMAAE